MHTPRGYEELPLAVGISDGLGVGDLYLHSGRAQDRLRNLLRARVRWDPLHGDKGTVAKGASRRPDESAPAAPAYDERRAHRLRRGQNALEFSQVTETDDEVIRPRPANSDAVLRDAIELLEVVQHHRRCHRRSCTQHQGEQRT